MSRLLISMVVSAAFALLGWGVAGVTLGGATVGWAVAFLLFYGIGPSGFGILFAVFVITWITTRLGHNRKQRLGIAERRRGRRTAGQVLANVGISGAFAAIVMINAWVPHRSSLLRVAGTVAAIASLAEAAADTCSSECGEAFSDTAFLFPHFRIVPAGTDGAVTFLGTLCGFAATGVIAFIAFALGVLGGCEAWIAGTAGGFGMVVDTMLGATLERRGVLNNNAVNLCSTFASAVLALLFVISMC